MGRRIRSGSYRALVCGAFWSVLAVRAAMGWSPMLEISHTSRHERSTPCIHYGTGGTLPEACIGKLDSDTDVDPDDAAVFLLCVSGTDGSYAPNCADAVLR